MIDRSIAQHAPVSTPEQQAPERETLVVDARYAELLAEDLGCKVTTARTCFWGEPRKRALGVVEWAIERAPDDPEKRAKLILAWAKHRQAGAFRQDVDAEREIASAMAEYWTRNPEKLAETLKLALRNGGGE